MGPTRTALRAHEILVVERVVLGSALLCLGAGPRLALPLLGVVVVVTWLLQHFMRHRYEFTPSELVGYGKAADTHTPR